MNWLQPDWPAPPNIVSVVSPRSGGVSTGRFRGLNLAGHVGDEPARVEVNRKILVDSQKLAREPCWLSQVHGSRWVRAETQTSTSPEADAVLTDVPKRICAILSADCLPVLFCTRDGRQCGAAHAGWRGLISGILGGAVSAFGVPPSELIAWLGPAIGPCHYEVSDELQQRFVDAAVTSMVRGARRAAFRPGRTGHCFADLYELARIDLRAAGLRSVHGGGLCTHCDPDAFYSHRRDGITGRFATLIWRQE